MFNFRVMVQLNISIKSIQLYVQDDDKVKFLLSFSNWNEY